MNDIQNRDGIPLLLDPCAPSIAESGATKVKLANLVPKWLVCMLAIAIKYYERADSGQRLSDYKSALIDDIRKYDYWVAGRIFDAESKAEKMATVLVSAYPEYSKLRKSEKSSGDDSGGLKISSIVKGDDQSLSRLRESGGYRLAQIWVANWKDAELWVKGSKDDKAFNRAVKETEGDLEHYFGQAAAAQFRPEFKLTSKV